MKKITALILALCMCMALTACGGVVIDENEEIAGNGTGQVVKGGSVYAIADNTVTKDNEVLYEITDIKDEKLFALGEYLYVNTWEGAMQLRLDGSKMKRFGSGEIIGTKGRWIYYQSADNKVGNMIVYKIDMKDGRQLNLFQDEIVEVTLIDEDVFYFKGVSGNEYVNALGSDEGMFYHQWLENNEKSEMSS